MSNDQSTNLSLTVSPAMLETIATAVATGIAKANAAAADASGQRAKLQADYQVTVDIIKVLTDIRFRCLVFVTAIIALANALIPASGQPGTRIAVATVGFLATLGIAIYELRNSQLYEAAIHRATIVEASLGMIGASQGSQGQGLFTERPLYVAENYWRKKSAEERAELIKNKQVRLMTFLRIPVKHDHGLALIYGAALGGWTYLLANGLFSLPAPQGLPSTSASAIPIIAALIGLVGFLIAALSFVHHDRNRFRPTRPAQELQP